MPLAHLVHYFLLCGGNGFAMLVIFRIFALVCLLRELRDILEN